MTSTDRASADIASTHDTSAPPVAGDPTSFPTHAECVRTLLGDGGFATLTTSTVAGPTADGSTVDGSAVDGSTRGGYPYGTLAAYSVMADGSILLCLSDMAEHTRNARADPRSGLLVTAKLDEGCDPLDEPRASILGDLRPHAATADDVERHLVVHPLAAAYLHYRDFSWWRLEIASARFVGGFSSMSWVTGAEVGAAVVDEVRRSSRPAIDHMNADHAEANLDMARHLGGLGAATSARIHALDRHGVTLYADVDDEVRTVRLRFPDGPLASAHEVRAAVVDLARRARAAATR